MNREQKTTTIYKMINLLEFVVRVAVAVVIINGVGVGNGV